jgi:hypothetical protein
MNTSKRHQFAVLTNGRTIQIRNRIVRGGMLVGFSKWDGTFLNIANVAWIDTEDR